MYLTFRLFVDSGYKFGFMVRTMKPVLGKPAHHALSRKTGEWVRITAEQIREQDLPTECLFAADELPLVSRIE